MRAISVLSLLCAWASPAFACPACAAGIAARARVLGPELWTNLTVALLPFLVVALVCLRIERRGAR